MSNLSHVTADNAKDGTSFAHFERYFKCIIFSWRTLFCMIHMRFPSTRTNFHSGYAKLNCFSIKRRSIGANFAHFMLNVSFIISCQISQLSYKISIIYAKSRSVYAKSRSIHAKFRLCH